MCLYSTNLLLYLLCHEKFDSIDDDWFINSAMISTDIDMKFAFGSKEICTKINTNFGIVDEER